MQKPKRRSSFLNDGDERNYLSDVVTYSMRKNKSVDTEILRRFESLLANEGDDNGSIVLQEQWSLLYEALGEYTKAIKHKVKELGYVEDVFAIAGPVSSVNYDYMIEIYAKLNHLYNAIHAMDFGKS